MKNSLRTTATKLLNNYGNDVVLTKTIPNSTTYDPILDEYVNGTSEININAKCVYRQYKQGTFSNEEYDKSIKRIAIIAYQDSIAGLDSSWKFNNNKIFVVEQSIVENGTVLFKLFVG